LSTILVVDEDERESKIAMEADQSPEQRTEEVPGPPGHSQIPTVYEEEDALSTNGIAQFTMDTIVANIDAERKRNEVLLHQTLQTIALVSSSEEKRG
jgi:hypothetical protein